MSYLDYENFDPKLPSPGSKVLYRDEIYTVYTIKVDRPKFTQIDVMDEYYTNDIIYYNPKWIVLIYNEAELKSYKDTFPYTFPADFFIDRFCKEVPLDKIKWGEEVELLYGKV